MNTTVWLDDVTSSEPEAQDETHEELALIAERVLEVPQPDTPRLDIHRSGCQVSITWLGTEETFRLEVSDRAYASAAWQPVLEPVRTAGGVHRVVLPGASHVRYVRLARSAAPRASVFHRVRPVQRVQRVPDKPARRPSRPPSVPSGAGHDLAELLDVTALGVLVALTAFVLIWNLASTL